MNSLDPTWFEGSNGIDSGSEGGAKPIPVHDDGKIRVTCWKLTFWQWLCLLWSPRIFLTVEAETDQPAVTLTIDKPIE